MCNGNIGLNMLVIREKKLFFSPKLHVYAGISALQSNVDDNNDYYYHRCNHHQIHFSAFSIMERQQDLLMQAENVTSIHNYKQLASYAN